MLCRWIKGGGGFPQGWELRLMGMFMSMDGGPGTVHKIEAYEKCTKPITPLAAL